MEIYRIYALIDPLRKQIKYIGQTTLRLNDRLSCHICEAKTHKKLNKRQAWIKSILNKGFRPEIEELEICYSKEEMLETEVFYIEYFKFIGADLKNDQPGGEGQPKGYQFKKRHVPPKGIIPPQLLTTIGWIKVKGMKRTKENLERNKQSKIKNGTYRKRTWSKPIISVNVLTREEKIYPGLTDVCKDLGIKISQVSNILNRNKWELAKEFTFFFQAEGVDFSNRNIRIVIGTKNNTEIKFLKVTEAAKSFNMNRDHIYRSIDNSLPDKNGYTWRLERVK